MPSSTDSLDSNRQSAVDRLDRLDRLGQTVDGRTISSQQVYDLASQFVEQTCGFVPLITLRTLTGDRSLNDAGRTGEPSTKTMLRPLAQVSLPESVSIVIEHPDPNATLDVDWQDAFLTSVAECCSFAFLRQFYADSGAVSEPASHDEPRSKSPMLYRVAAVAVGLILIAFIPVTFRLPTEGTLEPSVNVGVFAPTAGELTKIAVVDGTRVESGDVLAQIDNPELRLQAERLRGELLAAQADLASTQLNASHSSSRRDTAGGQSQNSSTKVAVLRTRIGSLQRQVSLMEEILESLVVRAHQPGRVVIDDRQTKSVGQSVLPSQQLMRLADDRSGHQAIVRIPAESYGYVDTDSPVSASIRLRSDPSRRFDGVVSRVSDTVQIDERGQSFIELVVDIEGLGDSDVRMNAPVIGHVHVGRRSLAFIVFRPFIELIRENSW